MRVWKIPYDAIRRFLNLNYNLERSNHLPSFMSRGNIVTNILCSENVHPCVHPSFHCTDYEAELESFFCQESCLRCVNYVGYRCQLNPERHSSWYDLVAEFQRINGMNENENID